jgi:hypothetical protein
MEHLPMKSWINFLCGVILLAGCKSIGPKAIRQNHPLFNQAIVRTLDEQLLLNIVRLRYLDTPYFLDIGHVSDSYELSLNAGMGRTKLVSEGGRRRKEFCPELEMVASQAPTMVYTPMQGQNFVKRFYAPVPLPILLAMIQSGWNGSRVLAIFVEQINDLKNAPTASGPTPAMVPEYADFFHFINVMTPLLREGILIMGIDPSEQKRLLMRVAFNKEYAREITLFKDLLDVNQSTNEFFFQDNFLMATNGSLRLRLRSLQSALFYLSNGVQVPQEDIDNGTVICTRHPQGQPFDWTAVLGNIFTVRYSEKRPEKAYLAVPYRGYWFYIAEDDNTSKSTFVLIDSIFKMQTVDSQIVIPTLTLPVGGR